MSRLSHLSSAFRDIPLTIGEHTLRPITAGTMMLLMETGNALFTETAVEPSEAESMQALFEFIWVHCGPRTEVIRQCNDPEELRAAARDFALDISFEDLDSFTEQFTAVRTRLNAALVDVVPEPGAKKPHGAMPPHTGSPLLSTPSAEPETVTENTTSCGISLSIEPSNTCTPPMPKTEPAPDGKSRIWEAPPSAEETPENVIPLE
jgi:hypothetical protein